MFCVAVAFSNLGGIFPAFALVLIIGVILSLIVYCTSVDNQPPRYHDVSLFQHVFFFFLQLAQGKLIPDVCLWDQRTFRTKFFKLTVESMQFWEPLNLYIIWQLLTTRVIMSHSFCCPSYSARTAGRLVQSCQPLCIGHHLSAKTLTVLRYYAHAKIIMPKNVNKIIKWSFSCLWLCMGIFREKDRVCYIATGIFLGLSHNQSSFAL